MVSHANKKRKLSSSIYCKKQDESWKEQYYKSMVTNDEKLCDANIQKAELKSYNLLLRALTLEKSLGLQEHEIIGIRSSINTNLIKLPTHLSQITVEDARFDDLVEDS